MKTVGSWALGMLVLGVPVPLLWLIGVVVSCGIFGAPDPKAWENAAAVVMGAVYVGIFLGVSWIAVGVGELVWDHLPYPVRRWRPFASLRRASEGAR